MTQVWPSAENFLVNDSIGYEFPDRYLGITVTASNGTNRWTGEGISKDLLSQPGVLHARGSLNSAAPPGFQFEACFQSHDGQFDSSPGGTGDVRLMSCVDRQFWNDNAEVKANFAMYDFGSANARTMEGYFVYGRVRNGLLSTATSADFTDTPRKYIKEPEGIFFGHIRDDGELNDRFVLGTFQAGSAVVRYETTVEDSGAVLAGASSNVQPFKHFKPRSLRMVCNGTRVICYAEIGPALVRPYQNADPVLVGSNDGGVQVQGEVEVFDIDSAFFVEAEGRWGFGTQGYINGSDYNTYMTVKSFELSTLGPTTQVMRDEFRRPFLRLGYRVPELSGLSQFQPGGHSLQQAWTGDEHGSGMGTNPSSDTNNFTVHHSHLLGDQTNDYVVMGADPFLSTPYAVDEGQNYGWYIRQDMVSDSQQRARATFTIDAATQYEIGVALRYTPQYFPQSGQYGGLTIMRSRLQDLISGDPDGSIADGMHNAYVASVVKDGVDTRVVIQRFNQSSPDFNVDADVIARTEAITAPTSGVPFEIDFECQNLDLGQGSFPSMRVMLDSVEQTFVPSSGDAGIGIEFDGGYLTDISSLAVLDGIGVGVKYEHAGASWVVDAVRWNSFDTEEASVPSDPPEEDQLTIPVDSEVVGKSGSLTTDLSWSITEEHCDVDRRMRTQTGFMNSGPQLSTRRRRWQIKLSGGTYEQTDAFHDLYHSNYAGSIPFDWTRQDTGETVAVRFLRASLPYKHIHTAGGTGAGEVTAVVEELFETRTFNPEAGPPAYNLVLFMMDDTGRSQMPMYDDLNRWPTPVVAASYPYPSMPFLTGKADTDGIRYTQARVDARCAPTRAAIFTGRQGHRTNKHTYGTGVGDVIANTPSTNEPFHIGITSAQNPWPGVARRSGVDHGIAMFGKYHLFNYAPEPVPGEGVLSARINPRAIVDEAGFEEGHECLRLGDGSPEFGFFNFPYTYTTETTQQVFTAGSDPEDDLPEGDVFSPALMFARATSYIHECLTAVPPRPFVIDWEMNLVHDILPAMEPIQALVDPITGSNNVTLFTCYTRDELIPDSAGNNGETNAGGYFADGTEDLSGTNPLAVYGPEGQVHTEWRRTRAALEACDTLADKLDEYVRVNHPEAYEQTIWMHYSDNGALNRANAPLETKEFESFGTGISGDPYFNCIPPTTTGEVSSTVSELYHVPEDGKGSTKDEGILTPLIVWGEPIPAGVRGMDCGRYVDACDFYPTILDIISPNWRDFITVEEYGFIDGVSFFGSMFDLSDQGKQFTHHCIFEPGYVHTTTQEVTLYDFSLIGTAASTAAEGYKLRRVFETGETAQTYELYNLATDPKETINVVSGGSAADEAARDELLDPHKDFFGQPNVTP